MQAVFKIFLFIFRWGECTVCVYSNLMGWSMPAIRYRFNGAACVVGLEGHDLNNWLLVRLHGGKEQGMPFVGFICRHATAYMPGGAYAKIVAAAVSPESSTHTGEWTDLGMDQVVLGWRVLYSDKGQSRWAVYAIVGDDGCPVVVTDKNYTPPRGPDLAGVSYLSDRRRKRAPGGETKLRA